jgi:hypothetical protein
MLYIGEKGQAFDTFKLMIAAVVAVAILGILMSILSIINPVTTDPTDTMKDMLKKGMQQPKSKVVSQNNVRFNKIAGEEIAKETMVYQIGISKDGVTLDCTDAPSELASACEDSGMIFKENVDVYARIGVKCDSISQCTVFVMKPV